MRKTRVAVFLLLAAATSRAQGPSVDHQAVQCVVAEKFPRFEARLLPADNIASARVVFQSDKTDQWWSVAMKVEGGAYVGVLPKPKKSLKSFRYYIEATDKAVGTARTPDFSTAVVSSSGECKGRLAAALGAASVLIQGPAGVALPAGFASTGVIAGGAAGAATGSAGAATGGSVAGAGGGLGAGAVIAGVGVAAAGAAVAVGAKGGDDSGFATNTATTSAPRAMYDVVFPSFPPGFDASACSGGTNTTFSGMAGITPDAAGNFSELHSQSTPVVRVTGQVTATSFQATLACVNGARTGSMSASGGPTSYSGTFSFGPQSGPITVTKR